MTVLTTFTSGTTGPDAMGTLNSMLGGQGTPYLGQVATAGLIPDNRNASAFQVMSRTPHYARENITSLQLVFGNFYMNGTPKAESAQGSAAATIEASVEYPVGVFTRVTFSGANQGSIPAGAMITSDALPIVIPFGASFWVRSFYANTDGIIFCAYPNFGNLLSFGTTTPNLVMGGGNPASQAGAGYGPLAIIAQTRRPAIALVGDSRVVGLGDTADATLARGYVARGVGPGLAYINMGVGSDEARGFIVSSTNRRALAAYCSHVICEYGINDLANGRTAAQAHADLQTLYAMTSIVGKPLWQCSLEAIGVTGPYTTEAAQTAGGTAAARNTFNATLRAGVAGVVGVIDMDSILTSPNKDGVWTVAGVTGFPTTGTGTATTTDGSHANRFGNILAQPAVSAALGGLSR